MLIKCKIEKQQDIFCLDLTKGTSIEKSWMQARSQAFSLKLRELGRRPGKEVVLVFTFLDQ